MKQTFAILTMVPTSRGVSLSEWPKCGKLSEMHFSPTSENKKIFPS